MIHLEFLVEELSAERMLNEVVPRIAPGVEFSIRTFQGKQDLLAKLPSRLAGYAAWAPQIGRKIVVLVDRDDDDCHELKATIERHLATAGLVSLYRAAGAGQADACSRVVVEELEAWFFGDVSALREAYPRLPSSLAHQRAYRDPDAISGGTAEALERILARYGYGDSLAKIATASAVAQHMNVEANHSTSFIIFRDGVRRLVSSEHGDA